MKFLLFFLSLFSFSSWGFIQVNPVRIILKDSTFGHFTVRNTQGHPVEVKITNKFFQQDKNREMKPGPGGTEEIEKVIFSPANFTIPPGDKQVVRFFIKDKFQEKEKRTYAHLLTEVKDDNIDKSKMMVLTPNVAIAIPILFRKNTILDNIEIRDLKLTQQDKNCVLSMEWSNKSHSSYINIDLLDANEKIISQLNGVSNYLDKLEWLQSFSDTNCNLIKKIKVFDVDNNIHVYSRDF
ncbi:MAG TPA: fimbria/pilus periplasmic chaperone [Bacteriovoracaceae bacterium]|nr:fimbria/pilus periplasmic chaperone [Bacteriovoracaceae bacterium]